MERHAPSVSVLMISIVVQGLHVKQDNDDDDEGDVFSSTEAMLASSPSVFVVSSMKVTTTSTRDIGTSIYDKSLVIMYHILQ